MNKETKHLMYDIVDFKLAIPILSRSFLLAASQFFTIYAIKALPLVFVSLILSTQPIWITILSFILLKESISLHYIVCLLVSFLGITLMFIGTLMN